MRPGRHREGREVVRGGDFAGITGDGREIAERDLETMDQGPSLVVPLLTEQLWASRGQR